MTVFSLLIKGVTIARRRIFARSEFLLFEEEKKKKNTLDTVFPTRSSFGFKRIGQFPHFSPRGRTIIILPTIVVIARFYSHFHQFPPSRPRLLSAAVGEREREREEKEGENERRKRVSYKSFSVLFFFFATI